MLRYQARLERPLLVATLLFLAAICVPVIWPDLGRGAELALNVINYVVWALFALDYLVRLRLAPQKWRFVRRHPFDLIVVLVPFLRPLRLLRLFSLIGSIARRSKEGLVKELAKYVTAITAATAFLGAVASLAAERGKEGSTINSFWDALWYSTDTMTAVPYGDIYPVTPMGRLVSVFLQIAGLVLVGMVTGAIAAWMVSLGGSEVEVEEAAQLDAVESRLAAMEAALVTLAANSESTKN
jgi:voltage-gated potassium channel